MNAFRNEEFYNLSNRKVERTTAPLSIIQKCRVTTVAYESYWQ